MHGVERSTVHCPAIDGIIKEADEIAGEVDDKQVLVNFIPLAQRRESGDAPSLLAISIVSFLPASIGSHRMF
jgi:hypothetical protein